MSLDVVGRGWIEVLSLSSLTRLTSYMFQNILKRCQGDTTPPSTQAFRQARLSGGVTGMVVLGGKLRETVVPPFILRLPLILHLLRHGTGRAPPPESLLLTRVQPGRREKEPPPPPPFSSVYTLLPGHPETCCPDVQPTLPGMDRDRARNSLPERLP